MSLLGIDIGTTGTKVVALSTEGKLLALTQCEYDVVRPQPGWAELDSQEVWRRIQSAIRQAAAETASDPVTALSISSMGEAMTPVSKDRLILGNCLLGFDSRGGETIERLAQLDPVQFFERSGNVPSLIYGGQKLIWLRDHQQSLFEQTDKFLGWGALAVYLLGGDAVEDYACANRTLFLDVNQGAWSDETLSYIGMPREKLPAVAQAGTCVGTISRSVAEGLGLPPDVKIILGTHDQCANALGAGVIRPGMAAYGLGTYICITPAYDTIPPTAPMIDACLNVEHHALAGLYVSFLYNLTGGALLKWFRDTFASREHQEAQAANRDVYDLLLAELPPEPTGLMVLPHFAPTGPPYFDPRPYGMIAGLTLETTRGEFIKGLLEGVTYYFRDGLKLMTAAGIDIDEFRVTGGGARSAAWLQIMADIIGKPLARLRFSEASALGAAILAGVGSGVYASAHEAIQALVQIDRVVEPDPRRQKLYDEAFARYHLLYPFSQTLKRPQ
jgi:xylulokinase